MHSQNCGKIRTVLKRMDDANVSLTFEYYFFAEKEISWWKVKFTQKSMKPLAAKVQEETEKLNVKKLNY